MEMANGSISSPSMVALPSNPPIDNSGTVEDATEDTPGIARSSSSRRS
jgi:hypothetical protein